MLHVTSLPSRFGIGDLGPEAHRFVDFLSDSGQTLWQMLPINPTSAGAADSPYSCTSAFAGNWMLISPELLVTKGLLKPDELDDAPRFPAESVDYDQARDYKNRLVDLACRRQRDKLGTEFDIFCANQADWLDDYAAFEAISLNRKSQPWYRWPAELRDLHHPRARKMLEHLKEEIELVKVRQHLFFDQWHSLRRHCDARGIQLFGDIPIYIAHDTADAWAKPGLFLLDEKGRMEVVSGVPATSFNPEGQRWGMPLYDWRAHAAEGYKWWINRLRHNLEMFDWVRIDHFLGLVDYWAIPRKSKSALKGSWHQGPREDFFNAVYRHLPCLPIVAEDLGLVTPDARQLMDRYSLQGMRVLVDGFNEEPGGSYFLPHNHVENCMVYTSTHDTHTVIGWYSTAGADQKRRMAAYFGHRPHKTDLAWDFIRMAMSSVGVGAVVQMQDLLSLGEDARMNRPGLGEGNWKWRMKPNAVTAAISRRLGELTSTYGRV